MNQTLGRKQNGRKWSAKFMGYLCQHLTLVLVDLFKDANMIEEGHVTNYQQAKVASRPSKGFKRHLKEKTAFVKCYRA
jgi:hypothetical protein